MMRILDLHSRWQCLALALATIMLSVLFSLGVSRENRMLRDLALARASAAERISDQQHHMNAWIAAEPEERTLWQAIDDAYAEQVTGGQVRRTVPYALAALADECGVTGLSLTELEETSLQRSILDEIGGSWRPLRETTRLESSPSVEIEGEEIIDFGYHLRFRSGYQALGRFLDGLERIPGMISVHSVVIRRNVPQADVDLILVAQGRRT